MTLEQRPEEGEGVNLQISAFKAEGGASSTELLPPWPVQGVAQKATWLELSGQGAK